MIKLIYGFLVGYLISNINVIKDSFAKLLKLEKHTAIFITKDANIKAIHKFFIEPNQNSFKFNSRVYTFDNTNSKKVHFYFIDSSDEIKEFKVDENQDFIVKTVHNTEIVTSFVATNVYKKLFDVKIKKKFNILYLLISVIVIYIIFMLIFSHFTTHSTETAKNVAENVSNIVMR